MTFWGAITATASVGLISLSAALGAAEAEGPGFSNIFGLIVGFCLLFVALFGDPKQ